MKMSSSAITLLSTFGVFLILACSSSSCESLKVSTTDVTNLTRELLKRYEETSENFIVPFGEKGYPLEISFNWYPSNILSFEWYDPALRWSSNASEPPYLNIPTEKIWKPDSFVQESQVHQHKSVLLENELAFVHRNGTVSWSSDVTTSTFCQVFQRNFPFDRQACSLTFSTAAHFQKEVVFINLNATSFYKTISNGAWESVNVTVPDCPDLQKLKDRTAIRFVVELKRIRKRYYVITLVIPCFLLSLFTSLIFTHPRDTPSRIDFATMNVLTLFVYQSLVSSVGPPTGTSLLGVLLLITLFEAATATVLAILWQRLCEIKDDTGHNHKTTTDDEIEHDSVNTDTKSAEWYLWFGRGKKYITGPAILLIVKFSVVCIVALMFAVIDNNPKDKIQCREGGYIL